LYLTGNSKKEMTCLNISTITLAERIIKFISGNLNWMILKEMVGLKSNFVVDIQYKEINSFSWRVREKINEIIEKMVQQKFGQNMSNKEKICITKPNPSKK
jgi:hypothetical protein